MDRVIEKKFWNKKRIWTIAGITALALLIIFSIVMAGGKSKLNVDTERITISEVTKAPFKEYIPVNGILLPSSTI
ncbi:MAG TPA: efflux transporter periplasmic adaptor subunit, partial [Niabella sp.]